MLRRFILVCLFGTVAAAQQRPIFDVDDFVDPRLHRRPIFISRLLAGGALNFVDDYRPLNEDVGFVHVANNLYVSRFQFSYKHSEVAAENGAREVRVCGCDPPLYFPTPPPGDATPAAPGGGSRDMVQAAWYRRRSASSIMLRYRATFSRQTSDTIVRSFTTGEIVERRSGREQSFGLDADTHVRIGDRDLFGSLVYARTRSSGTDRSQQEFTYTHRFPGMTVKAVHLRALLTVGGVSNRGGTAINVANPYFEAFFHEHRTRANFHLVWSPQSTRSGNGWETHHQIAIFVNHALIVHPFGKGR